MDIVLSGCDKSHVPLLKPFSVSVLLSPLSFKGGIKIIINKKKQVTMVNININLGNELLLLIKKNHENGLPWLPVLSKFGHKFKDRCGDTRLVVPDFYCTM